MNGSLETIQILGKQVLGDFLTHPPEMLAETFESGPLCITDLFKNKSVAYFLPITGFIYSLKNLFYPLYYVTFQCGHKNIFKIFFKFFLPTKS